MIGINLPNILGRYLNENWKGFNVKAKGTELKVSQKFQENKKLKNVRRKKSVFAGLLRHEELEAMMEGKAYRQMVQEKGDIAFIDRT